MDLLLKFLLVIAIGALFFAWRNSKLEPNRLSAFSTFAAAIAAVGALAGAIYSTRAARDLQIDVLRHQAISAILGPMDGLDRSKSMGQEKTEEYYKQTRGAFVAAWPYLSDKAIRCLDNRIGAMRAAVDANADEARCIYNELQYVLLGELGSDPSVVGLDKNCHVRDVVARAKMCGAS